MKTIFMRTKFDVAIDYDEIARMFSKASGSKVWCEREGEYINVLTDGNPKEVLSRISDKVAGEFAEKIFDEIFAFELGGLRQWERNARLN